MQSTDSLKLTKHPAQVWLPCRLQLMLPSSFKMHCSACDREGLRYMHSKSPPAHPNPDPPQHSDALIPHILPGSWQAEASPASDAQACVHCQVWLAIYNILTGAESRAKALSGSARCSAALRLRPLLTDILMDQLPVLKHLRRVLDELMLGCVGTAPDHLSSCLILEQVSDASLPCRHLHILLM